MYAEMLKKLFGDLKLEIEDILLLESFQIAYLPERLPAEMMRRLCIEYPLIRRFIEKKHPPIAPYIQNILTQSNLEIDSNQENVSLEQLVWEIADLIVYNKVPEVYDQNSNFGLDFREVTQICALENKVVIDAGAGTGRATFEAARFAQTVFAVEPISRLRQFIRDKIKQRQVSNIFVTDGFLHQIPLPDQFADVLITSHAIGWQLEAELHEIERVVKPGGSVVHLTGFAVAEENPVHATITAAPWHYSVSEYRERSGLKIKYWKKFFLVT